MKILILGKVPPPSGGVTVHVSRLLSRLTSLGVDCDFYSMSKGALAVCKTSLKYQVIHLHTSNPYFRFLFALFCKMLRIRLIQTYHGDLGRFGRLKNAFDMGSVMLTRFPVVINAGSYEKAVRRNRDTKLVSSFIAPSQPEFLPGEIDLRLEHWMGGFDHIFCTNASCLKYDKYGHEVYGGLELLGIFKEIEGSGLIFSDPSGEYLEHFRSKNLEIPKNMHVITGEHSFMEVIKRSDCFIRASTTDGDSVSIKEALFLKINVIASDCVGRPEGCQLYRSENFGELKELILKFRKGKHQGRGNFDQVENLIELYM